MTTTAPRQTFPPITCREWCAEGDGHPHEHPEDQRCVSGWDIIPLELMPKWKDFMGAWNTTEVEVQAVAGPQHPPQAVIYSAGEDIELRLTPAEARRLAALIVEAADRLEAAR